MRDRDKILGLALIVLGALFLLGRVVDVGQFAWPLFVLVPGLVLLGSAFLGPRSSAGLAVPGAIVTTIGLILFVLNGTGNWESWSYAWGLIVAGAGAGNFIFGALTKDHPRERDGLRTVYVGLALFAAFGVFFEFIIFGGMGGVLRWLLPLALIGAGVYLLFFRDRTGAPSGTAAGTATGSQYTPAAPPYEPPMAGTPAHRPPVSGADRAEPTQDPNPAGADAADEMRDDAEEPRA